MLNDFCRTDTQILNDIRDRLALDSRLPAALIGVSTYNGIVTLRGTVPHYFEKTATEELVRAVSGVRAVVDELEVNQMDSHERSDEDLAEAALTAIRENCPRLNDAKVTVDRGWVTLRGVVEESSLGEVAEAAINHLMGVRGVTNYMSIKAGVHSADVKVRIEEALKLTALREARMINVEVKGNRVILSGHVHSLSEVQAARLAAFNAPGVESVECHLLV